MQEILSKKILGERIKNLRIENSYTQDYVADFLNLPISTYSQIELGKEYPTIDTLNRISRHYKKSYEWRLHDDDIQKTTDAGQILEIKSLNASFGSVLKELENDLETFSRSLKELRAELEQLKIQG